jgi:hypothetical protein
MVSAHAPGINVAVQKGSQLAAFFASTDPRNIDFPVIAIR